jgi:hypothetical protein
MTKKIVIKNETKQNFCKTKQNKNAKQNITKRKENF